MTSNQNKQMNLSNSTISNNTTPISLSEVSLIAILIGSFILTYFPVWKGLVLAWYNSNEYSHGFFIVPLCCYILWRKKKILAEMSIKPSSWGLILVIFSLLIYLFAHFAEITTLTSYSMVLLLAGAIIYFFGLLMFKELIFPLFLLLFMIPIPTQIYSKLTIPLQLFVSNVSVSISSLFDIPIYREGNVIHLPNRTLQVVQACSGLRSMVSLLVLSAILGYFALRSNILRIILFFSGIPTAILVNIIRVLFLVLAFHYLNFDLTEGITHTVFGIIIFFLALIFIIIIKIILSSWDKSAA